MKYTRFLYNSSTKLVIDFCQKPTQKIQYYNIYYYMRFKSAKGQHNDGTRACFLRTLIAV